MATAAVVTFVKNLGQGPSFNASYPDPYSARSRQNFATLTAATTTDTAQDGEIAMVGNSGTSMIAVAIGSTPDATATASTSATSAGMPVPPGAVVPKIVGMVFDPMRLNVGLAKHAR